MRLETVARGATWRLRVLYRVAGLGRNPIPDVRKSLWHRPDFWGTWQRRLTQRVMRGPSPWTAGERELMAAFCSRQFQCPF